MATCRQSPYLHKPAIIIMTSLVHLSHPCSHYDVILIMASFATELATPSIITDERTDTLLRLICKNKLVKQMVWSWCR